MTGSEGRIVHHDVHNDHSDDDNNDTPWPPDVF